MALYPFSDCTTYERKTKCSRCGKSIPAGKNVYGDVLNGRNLSHRRCYDCDQVRVNNRVKIRQAQFNQEVI